MKGKQKVRIGLVIGDKMDKTRIVAVETRRPHPLYRRTIRIRRKYKVHDESNTCRRGDLVRIVETRPLSKEKRWRVAEILTRRQVATIAPEEIGIPDIQAEPAEVSAELEAAELEAAEPEAAEPEAEATP